VAIGVPAAVQVLLMAEVMLPFTTYYSLLTTFYVLLTTGAAHGGGYLTIYYLLLSTYNLLQVLLMAEVISSICEQMVDGYATIKRISDEGRAMMTIDVQTLQAGL